MLTRWVSTLLFAPLVLAAGCSADGKPAGDASPAGGDVITLFNHYYLDGPGKEERIFGSTYLGVPAIQNPADMWMFQEILTEVRPDVVIETGTAAGGSALAFAAVLEYLNPESKVITIDIAPQVDQAVQQLPSPLRERVSALLQRRVEVVESNSVDPKLIEWLATRCKGKKVLVTLDSCHAVEHVARELQLYAPLVSVGSYLVVQDTRHDENPAWVSEWSTCPGYTRVGGPGLAVDEFLKTNSDFQADRTRERFLLTWYPRGYLKRVR